MTNSSHTSGGEHDERVRAEKIAAGAATTESAGAERGVRERVRRLVVESMEEANAGVNRLRDVATEVMTGAIEGTRGKDPNRRESVLKEVIDGLSDGVKVTANAARLTLEEARGRGESFAREDVANLAGDLQALERMFTDTVINAINRVGETLDGQREDLVNHARHTAQTIRPSVESAARAAATHPVMLATDVAAAGVRMSTMAAGRFAQALGGLLQSAGGRLAEVPPTGQAGSEAARKYTEKATQQPAGQAQGEREAHTTERPHPQAPPGGSPIPERPDVASNTLIPDDTAHIPPNAEQERRGTK